MYDGILFPTDGSEGARAGLDHALDIATTHDATLYILNVADTTHESVTHVQGEVLDVLEREGERIVEAAAAHAADRGVSTVTDVRQGGVSETIVAYVEEYGIDLTVMPTHGRTGLERVLLGSTTERVVRQAPVPVLTVRPSAVPFEYPYRNVLFPTDGSDCATAALDQAVGITNTTGATLHVFSVVDVTSLGIDIHSEFRVDTLEEHAQQVLAEAKGTAESDGVEPVVTATEFGSSIHGAINDYADDNDVDLVVMGTHGRTGVDRYLLGSVAEKTIRTASVPVLTVPAP